MNRYEEWQLKTPDGYIIHGETDFAVEGQRSDKVLVLVHGLTGHMAEYHIKGAANYFSSYGYDVIRFNLYDGDGGRCLTDCTLQTHASDLNQVLAEKAQNYQKLFIAGHSYGGPTIMIAQPGQATALSLWDPAFNLPSVIGSDHLRVEKQDGYYIWRKAVEVVLGIPMIEERRDRYDTDECLELSKAISEVPIQVIAADQGYGGDVYSWHSAGHEKNHRHVIDNADHCFWRGDVFNQVLDKTHQWFEGF